MTEGHFDLWRALMCIVAWVVAAFALEFFYPITDNRDLGRAVAARQSAEWEVKEYKGYVTNQQENYQALLTEFGVFQDEHNCKAKK
jgi:hypothetical protein